LNRQQKKKKKVFYHKAGWGRGEISEEVRRDWYNELKKAAGDRILPESGGKTQRGKGRDCVEVWGGGKGGKIYHQVPVQVTIGSFVRVFTENGTKMALSVSPRNTRERFGTYDWK